MANFTLQWKIKTYANGDTVYILTFRSSPLPMIKALFLGVVPLVSPFKQWLMVMISLLQSSTFSWLQACCEWRTWWFQPPGSHSRTDVWRQRRRGPRRSILLHTTALRTPCERFRQRWAQLQVWHSLLFPEQNSPNLVVCGLTLAC